VPRYDYGCASGHLEERFEDRDTSQVPCSECGRVARRRISTAPLINGVAVPPMRERKIPIQDFQNALDDQQTAARRAGVEPPDVWAAAKREAKIIQKHAPELVEGT